MNELFISAGVAGLILSFVLWRFFVVSIPAGKSRFHLEKNAGRLWLHSSPAVAVLFVIFFMSLGYWAALLFLIGAVISNLIETMQVADCPGNSFVNFRTALVILIFSLGLLEGGLLFLDEYFPLSLGAAAAGFCVAPLCGSMLYARPKSGLFSSVALVLAGSMFVVSGFAEINWVLSDLVLCFFSVAPLAFLFAFLMFAAGRNPEFNRAWLEGIGSVLFVVAVYFITRHFMRPVTSEELAGISSFDRMAPFWGVLLGFVLAPFFIRARFEIKSFSGSVSFLFFVSVSVWIAYLIAGKIGFVAAALGMAVAKSFRYMFDKKMDETYFVEALFSALAFFSAFSIVADEFSFQFTNLKILAGALLGGILPPAAEIVFRRTESAFYRSVSLGWVSVFSLVSAIPFPIGFLTGSDGLGGLMLGAIVSLVLIYSLPGKTDTEGLRAEGFMRFLPLLVILETPAIVSLRSLVF